MIINFINVLVVRLALINISLFWFLDCKVEELKTSKTKSCIFPFVINKMSFNGCTNKFDWRNQTWCPTKVDKNGNVYRNITNLYTGYCSEACPVDLKGTSKSILFTKSHHYVI